MQWRTNQQKHYINSILFLPGFPSNQQKRVSERALVKVGGQGHGARSKSTGLLQVRENSDTVYGEDTVYRLGHAAESRTGHAGLWLRLFPPRTFCGSHDLSIYVSPFFFLLNFFLFFCLFYSFKFGNSKIFCEVLSLIKLVIQIISYIMTSI